MAVLKEMVGRKVISGFRGVIDFYYCRGIPCARKWPKKPSLPRSPAVQTGIDAFSQAGIALHQLDPTVIEAYKVMAAETNLTWKDFFYRSYLAGIF